MASSNSNSNHHDSHGPPIPLQDLTGARGASDEADGGRRSRSGTTSGPWSTRTGPFGSQRGGGGGRYERVADDSPSRWAPADDGFDTVDLSDGRSRHARVDEDREEDFAAGPGFAHSMVGLSFDPDAPRQPSRYGLETGSKSRRNSEDLGSFSNTELDTSGDLEQYSSTPGTGENDTTPLTDRRYIQPISGAVAPQGPQNERRSVRFEDSPTPRGSRLGDDLPHLEEGRGGEGSHSDATRSRLSSSLAIQKAGSMMRMLSQRVVNLSNEPENTEPSVRRKSSIRQARMDGPPSLPAMTDYAHDASKGDLGSEEREMPSFWSKNPPAQSNPLRGKSLGIFSPENRLRKALCEVLIHPATETTILLIICIHTILLCIESNYDEERMGFQWGTPGFDYAFLVLFGFYTVELAAKIIVSGFIMNPTEYSTLDRSRGLKKAVVAKTRELFRPYRNKSVKNKPSKPAQASIFRTFTGFALQEPEKGSSVTQDSRDRLARRAFLRHSFNRLDFLAVVSYWISLCLALTGIERGRHLYIFRMLSCLRILRLMALTEGTTVDTLYPLSPRAYRYTDPFLAYSQGFEKGCAPSCQCRLLHHLLLVPICHHRSAEFQVQLASHLCLDRP